MSALSKNVISRFAKLTANKDTESKETTVYGTIKERNGSKYVLLDGAEILTPVTTTVEFRDGDRVSVLLKNHTATVTGNISSPARNASVGDLERTVKDQAVVIDNNQVHRGTTAPKNPIPGSTLWIDFSVDPPLLKQYTADKKWEAVGTDKVQTSYIAIRNNRIDIRTGGSLVIDTGASVSIRSGGTFTVEAENLSINEEGVISAKKASLEDATISGTLFASGYPVLHTGNVVISSAQPVNPKVGTVWINPNAVLQLEHNIKASSGRWEISGTYNAGTLEGDSFSAPAGIYSYTIRIPISSEVTSGVYYVRAVLDNMSTLVFCPIQAYTSSGLIWYEQTFTNSDWLGDNGALKVWIESSTSTDFSNLISDTGLLYHALGYKTSLTMICTPTNVTGWQNADVKYFAG